MVTLVDSPLFSQPSHLDQSGSSLLAVETENPKISVAHVQASRLGGELSADCYILQRVPS